MCADQQHTIKLKEHLALNTDQTFGLQESFSHQAISNALGTTSEESSVWAVSKWCTIKADPDPHVDKVPCRSSCQIVMVVNNQIYVSRYL